MVPSELETKIHRLVEDYFPIQVRLLKQLVLADSSNPFTPELSDKREPVELAVVEVLTRELADLGLPFQLIGASRRRPNIVCYWGQRRARKSLILNGHMDTVPPVGGKEKLVVRMEKDRLYGLGAYDMKASLAAFVAVLRALKHLGIVLTGELIVEFVVDEEPGACSGWGTRYLLNKGIKARAAIVAEPGNQIGIGHRGGYRFKLTTLGEAVHTGISAWQRQEKGRNAIVDMAAAVGALNQLEIPFKSARVFNNKKPVFTFPTKISGGSAINVVPERCEAYGDVRLMPGNSDRQVRMLIQERLATVPGLRYRMENLLFVPAVEIDEREEVVTILAEAFNKLGGTEPTVEGVGPWNDAWMFIKQDIPAVTQLPLVGFGAHGKSEWVSLKSWRQLTEVLVHTVISYLGVKE